jgi:hypothetical protein
VTTAEQQVDVERIANRFMRAIDDGDFSTLEALFTDDAMLDVDVPAWRFQRQEPQGIIAQFREWYPRPPITASWRAIPLDGGVLVEVNERKLENGQEFYYRFAYLCFLEGERIKELILYCTGPWDAATVERQRREAPMVRVEGS